MTIHQTQRDPTPRNAAAQPPVLTLAVGVLRGIFATIGKARAESGGALGGDSSTGAAELFHFDESSRTSGVTYSPDYKHLNRLFKYDWNPHDIRLVGFVHSHPARMGQPSYGDRIYAERILDAIDDLPVLWLPIVNTIPDTGQFTFTPWAVYRAARGVEVVRGQVKVLAGSAAQLTDMFGPWVPDGWVPDQAEDAIALRRPAAEPVVDVVVSVTVSPTTEAITAEAARSESGDTIESSIADPGADRDSTEQDRTFDRVKHVYDLSAMATSRVIAVGAGGAAAFLDDVARTGVGQFVLIDPDTVSETNLATQQVYRRDIGRPKVDCVAERIRDINPSTIAIALQKRLEEIDDAAFEELATGAINGRRPTRTVICGMTDSFSAQARVNRLALKFGLPSLCAQVYKEGRGAEMTFTYPGVTPACHRCILSSRYKYFLEEEHENPVTSHGAPLFATTRLNSIKEELLLVLLHHGTGHPRWGSMLEQVTNRNLIQISMAPDIRETLGLKVFEEAFEGADQGRLFHGQTVQLPEEPECPETGYSYHCPDCGGTGDLRTAMGKCVDTRVLPRLSETDADACTPS